MSENNDNSFELLNDELKLKIVNEWNSRPDNPPSINELITLCWPGIDPTFIDGRSKYGKAIREFLASRNIKVLSPTALTRSKTVVYELTKEQKEFIDNNAINMRPSEIAKALFTDLTSGYSPPRQAVYLYYRCLPSDKKMVNNQEENDLAEDSYRSPTNLERVCWRINTYLKTVNYDDKTLTGRQKKQCLSLIRYLQNYRFVHQINLYTSKSDRSLFESTFISYCYDKEDMSEEDVDQFIMLATEKVMSSNIQNTIVMLENEQKTNLAETGKLSMALVEAIKTSRDEFNASSKRQQSLYKTLTEERSQRLSEKMSSTATVLNLFEAWREKETRDQIIGLANEREKKIKEEIDRLESLDDLKCRWLGLGRKEIIEG